MRAEECGAHWLRAGSAGVSDDVVTGGTGHN